VESTNPPNTLSDVIFRDVESPPASEKDWVELVHAIAAGDHPALRALYQRSHRIVFTLIMRITNNRESAEEVTLDVFHDVWRRAEKYDPAGGSVIGWILNHARSRAIDRVAIDPDEAFAVAEQRRHVRTALTALTPHEREAIETAFFSELTDAEVAERLNRPCGAIKTCIRSGLGKLQRALRR
jgi:RNA polymerase sigma-70 factor, ECF subfamily